MTPAHYVVIDLEATCCDDDTIPRDEMEIIEIGAVLVDGRTLAPVGEFQTFVRPQRHRKLTAFCTGLTTITQADVDAAPRFPDALARLDAFLRGKDALFCSWGGYDRNQLRRDAQRHRVKKLPLGERHLNLKAAFSQRLGEPREYGTGQALRRVGLGFAGTHHRAIDDARNIARLLPFVLGAPPAAGPPRLSAASSSRASSSS
jgi:inhibitor of KinA sporulation pathway (predicted exonuclease)